MSFSAIIHFQQTCHKNDIIYEEFFLCFCLSFKSYPKMVFVHKMSLSLTNLHYNKQLGVYHNFGKSFICSIKYFCTPNNPIIERWDIRQIHRSKSKQNTTRKMILKKVESCGLLVSVRENSWLIFWPNWCAKADNFIFWRSRPPLKV